MEEKEVVLQEYKVKVLTVNPKTFIGQVIRGEQQFETEFPFSEIPGKQRPYITPGATFLWRVMGYDTPNTMKLTRFVFIPERRKHANKRSAL